MYVDSRSGDVRGFVDVYIVLAKCCYPFERCPALSHCAQLSLMPLVGWVWVSPLYISVECDNGGRRRVAVMLTLMVMCDPLMMMAMTMMPMVAVDGVSCERSCNRDIPLLYYTIYSDRVGRCHEYNVTHSSLTTTTTSPVAPTATAAGWMIMRGMMTLLCGPA